MNERAPAEEAPPRFLARGALVFVATLVVLVGCPYSALLVVLPRSWFPMDLRVFDGPLGDYLVLWIFVALVIAMGLGKLGALGWTVARRRWLGSGYRPSGATAWLLALGGLPVAAGGYAFGRSIRVAFEVMFLPFAVGVLAFMLGAAGVCTDIFIRDDGR